MIEWNEYINNLLEKKNDFDNLRISLDDGVISTNVPPIIKASISLLEKMAEHQGKLNVLVLPEKKDAFFTFTMMLLFHSIVQGKVESNYDPTGFKVGERLKVGNAVVEYLGTEIRDNHLCMMIKLAEDLKCSAPMELFPVFQKVSTKRRLSKYESFASARDAALASMRKEDTSDKLTYVSSMKTHLSKSIYCMTSIAGAKEQFSHCVINGKPAKDIFYAAQVNYEGELSNIGSGQMAGVPAVVFASDLYAVSAAASKGAPVGAIVVDGSNQNYLLNQLDVLDELIYMKIPVVCITDVANSFELEDLSARGFNIWRWDKDSITDRLFNTGRVPINCKTRNCAKQSVLYLKADGSEISHAMKILSSYRKEVQNQSSQMMKLFEKLNGLTFSALRTTCSFSEIDIEMAANTLSVCQKLLEEESIYLNSKMVDDYQIVINDLKTVYMEGYSIKKEAMFKDYLKQSTANILYLVIPDNGQKSLIQEFWSNWCYQQNIRTTVKVVFPSEYYSCIPSNADVTVICGWLKRAIMRKIIFSFNTENYVVLLYDYEDRWKKHDSTRWAKAIQNSSNKTIIENALSTDGIEVSTLRYEKQELIPEADEGVNDELGEIELILHENKFKQYVKGTTHGDNEAIPAIPVGFVGGFLTFYRTGHKVISATNIITSISDNIEQKLPAELQVGDFIVVREADRDLIRELADIALLNSGKNDLRGVASKWREALRIELLFCSVDELYEKLKKAGCRKGIATIKRWIEDEEIISPQSKEDLQIIAAVTENEMLSEMLDSIFDAAQEVREAHRLAGRKLSEQLRMTLAQELIQFGGIDPFNFWEPIDMEIEGIGIVKVLKIIDIGSEVEVDPADTNRLIVE